MLLASPVASPLWSRTRRTFRTQSSLRLANSIERRTSPTHQTSDSALMPTASLVRIQVEEMLHSLLPIATRLSHAPLALKSLALTVGEWDLVVVIWRKSILTSSMTKLTRRLLHPAPVATRSQGLLELQASTSLCAKRWNVTETAWTNSMTTITIKSENCQALATTVTLRILEREWLHRRCSHQRSLQFPRHRTDGDLPPLRRPSPPPTSTIQRLTSFSTSSQTTLRFPWPSLAWINPTF